MWWLPGDKVHHKAALAGTGISLIFNRGKIRFRAAGVARGLHGGLPRRGADQAAVRGHVQQDLPRRQGGQVQRDHLPHLRRRQVNTEHWPLIGQPRIAMLSPDWWTGAAPSTSGSSCWRCT